jgi:hypothetical protein
MSASETLSAGIIEISRTIWELGSDFYITKTSSLEDEASTYWERSMSNSPRSFYLILPGSAVAEAPLG